jgi:hypothetical protein
MKPHSAKAKGQRAAREVRSAFLVAFPHLGEDDILVTSSGANGVDLHLSPAAQDALQMPLAVEVKNHERLNIWQALAQARSNTKPGQTPILIFRRNREELHVSFRLSSFINLLRRTHGNSECVPGECNERAS